MSVMPMNEPNRQFCTTKLTRNRLEPKMLMLMSGCAMRFWRPTNSTRHAAPISSAVHTEGSAKPALDALENPSSRPPRPSVERAKEITSSDALRSGTSSRSTNSRASTNSTASAAIRMRKKLRHPHESTSAPPIVGPMLGANPIAMPAMPMAVPFCPLGKRIMAMDCTSGSVMPAANACITRASTSTGKFGATNATSEPAKKTPSTMKSRVRVDILSDKNVTRGTVMPSTSM